MSNRLKMANIHAIIGLLERECSYRRIARELGVDRETVARYDRLRHNQSKPAIVTPGSELSEDSNPASFCRYYYNMAASKADKGRRVIGYLRVSTGDQELANQRLGILELANRHGRQVAFIEETVSGMTSYKERKLGAVAEELDRGDILIVSELSRLGRSMVEVITLLGNLSTKGVKVYAVKGGYELDDSIQSKILSMVLCMASEIERDLISQRTREALARKKREGMRLGRPKGPGRSKLDEKIDEIRKLHEKKVSVASLAKIYGCSWPTMRDFIVKKVERGGVSAI